MKISLIILFSWIGCGIFSILADFFIITPYTDYSNGRYSYKESLKSSIKFILSSDTDANAASYIPLFLIVGPFAAIFGILMIFIYIPFHYLFIKKIKINEKIHNLKSNILKWCDE